LREVLKITLQYRMVISSVEAYKHCCNTDERAPKFLLSRGKRKHSRKNEEQM
jgi:hypothetical protein